MEEDGMEQEEIDEIKNDILNKTKTYEQLLKVCREYDNSFFGSNTSGWNGWGLKLIKR
jgi:hypothetical protein